MAVTLIGPGSTTIPTTVSPAVIEIKQNWGDVWQVALELELTRAVTNAAGQDLGSCELQRRYGASVKSPHEAAPAVRPPIELIGWWVQIYLMGEQGLDLSWVGRISSEARDVFSAATIAEGVQTWIAYEPLQELRKIYVGRSIWLENTEPDSEEDPDWTEKDIGWVPTMNGRGPHNSLVGNRSPVKSNGTYCYGGTDLWTHLEYAEYVLKRFAYRYDPDNELDHWLNWPEWQIVGQTDLLQAMTTTISFGSTQTVAEILRKLIPPSLGVDYTIYPIPQSPSPGFEIYVYSLHADEHSFGSATLSPNPNVVNVDMSLFPNVAQARVVNTLDQQYDRINVRGRRIVACCSLENFTQHGNSFVGKWPPPVDEDPDDEIPPTGLEISYRAGTGTAEDSAAKHDEARLADVYDPLYQWFGAPVLWDMQGGQVTPKLDAEGKPNGFDADNQTTIRRTLSWLPLWQGFDYSVYPPVDNNPVGYVPDFMSPSVWVYDPDTRRFVRSDKVGISVQALDDEWGVKLLPSPNHLLALNHFDDAADTAYEPKYDHELCIATIAVETDQRLQLTFDMAPGGIAAGHELNIDVPDAELWWLAPHTVTGMDANGDPRRLSASRVLRNDADRLAMVMAGAIARYYRERARAVITVKGLWPWSLLVGQILGVIQEGANTQFISAPITSVEWTLSGEPTTIIRTGFA